MITECPHCFTPIFPLADGRCPTCQKDTRDEREPDPTRTSLRVAQGAVLPAICCDCGKVAQRSVAVLRSSGGGGQSTPRFIQTLMALFVSAPISLYFCLRGIHKASVVQIKMPQCDECAQLAAPQPRYVDFENARMTFVVHQNLKEAIARQ